MRGADADRASPPRSARSVEAGARRSPRGPSAATGSKQSACAHPAGADSAIIWISAALSSVSWSPPCSAVPQR